MPDVMFSVTTVTRDGTKCQFPLPGDGVFDDSMKETLISVTKLLDFESTKYPSYGCFLLLPPVAPSHDRKTIILHYSDST